MRAIDLIPSVIMSVVLLALACCTLSTGQEAAATNAAAAAAAAAPPTTGVAATIVTDGQLFCRNQQGIVALTSLLGQPIVAEGASSQYVADVCAIIDAVPVAPPAAGTAVPTVAMTPPTS